MQRNLYSFHGAFRLETRALEIFFSTTSQGTWSAALIWQVHHATLSVFGDSESAELFEQLLSLQAHPHMGLLTQHGLVRVYFLYSSFLYRVQVPTSSLVLWIAFYIHCPSVVWDSLESMEQEVFNTLTPSCCLHHPWGPVVSGPH